MDQAGLYIKLMFNKYCLLMKYMYIPSLCGQAGSQSDLSCTVTLGSLRHPIPHHPKVECLRTPKVEDPGLKLFQLTVEHNTTHISLSIDKVEARRVDSDTQEQLRLTTQFSKILK